MKFTRLIENVSKKQVPAHVPFFIVEVMASDEEGEDVEVLCLFPHPLAVVLTFRITASIHHRPSQVVSERTVEREECLVKCIRRGMCNMLIVHRSFVPSSCATNCTSRFSLSGMERGHRVLVADHMVSIIQTAPARTGGWY